ncbi:alpha-amylase [Photobacterium damselae subsp. damselae]|uniref:alpha-amylase n=1 Tax=Photobacterium damselae TaxID=38293 RepID=UPI001EED6520|nr:alpha-amylase [Photobacterium damselae]UKA08055.1 alpha-amylase [Photobacterium damselae subsp. damselae]UKA23611.1 alpha-amylase [Photobacterium damselae subsp. damselae]
MKINLLIALISALSSSAVIANPSLTISTSTTSRDYPLSDLQSLVIPLVKEEYQLKIEGINKDCQSPIAKKIRFNQPLNLNCSKPTVLPMKIRFSGDYAFEYDGKKQTVLIKRAPKKQTHSVFKRPIPQIDCEQYHGGLITLDLANTYPDGTQLREVFTQQNVVVNNGKVRLTPSINSAGLVLLEPLTQVEPKPSFNYRNANIYFVMLDRFNNGDTRNDNSYGRHKDGKQEIGTFHGGDIQGVIDKLDYIQSLGTNVIWLSPIVEQVHGFVGGGDSGSFPFYAYHGYWTRDFTKIDANLGNESELRELVSQAHQRGIKVLLDAVINHAGYATLADLQLDDIQVVNREQVPKQWADWQPKTGQSWHSYNSLINYQSKEWQQWWGKDWVRAGLPDYLAPGSDDITMTLAGLPDFLTESEKVVTPPQWLLDNPDTQVKAKPNYTVSDYLIEWQTDWVKRFGIDGFRVDTVKHVDGEVWQRLKLQAGEKLQQWRQLHNSKNNEPFWMMGEVWGHGAYRSPYYNDGFDALINFDLQKKMDQAAVCFSQMKPVYQDYNQQLKKSADFNMTSYISSHDTELFFSRYRSFEMQKSAANALLLSPGAVQVFYGDEIGRDLGPYADDFHQGTRSDMVWKLNDEQQALLQHWQTVGQFRQRHPAVGAGVHQELTQQQGYAFSRQLGTDKVVVAFVGNPKK